MPALSLQMVFLPFDRSCNFLLIAGYDGLDEIGLFKYGVRCGGRKSIYRSMTGFQWFSDPMSLEYELHKFFSGFFSPLKWERMSRAGFGYFFSPRIVRLW